MRAESTLTQAVARLVLLPGIVVAVAVLVKGYSDTGDGFAAGVIAALTILIQYAAFGSRAIEQRVPAVRWFPAVAVAGLGLALGVAFVPAAGGGTLLTHAPGAGVEPVRLGTLELVTAVLFDLGVFLVVVGTILGAVSALARAAERGRP